MKLVLALALVVALLAACSDDHAFTGTANAHVVYLDFEGGLFHGGPEDATTNTAVGFDGDVEVPAYLDQVSSRTGTIGDIVGEAADILAPYGVELVLDRPAVTPYTMIVVTDLPPEDANCASCTAVGYLSCNTVANPLPGIVFHGAATEDNISANIVALVGDAAGIPFTSQEHDCMCFPEPCGFQTDKCTIGGAGTPVNSVPGCAIGADTIDEHQLFLDAYGARPK